MNLIRDKPFPLDDHLPFASFPARGVGTPFAAGFAGFGRFGRFGGVDVYGYDVDCVVFFYWSWGWTGWRGRGRAWFDDYWGGRGEGLKDNRRGRGGRKRLEDNGGRRGGYPGRDDGGYFAAALVEAGARGVEVEVLLVAGFVAFVEGHDGRVVDVVAVIDSNGY